MKNKTLTTWLTLLLGAFGLHRFYLYGSRDAIAWLMVEAATGSVAIVIKLAEFASECRKVFALRHSI